MRAFLRGVFQMRAFASLTVIGFVLTGCGSADPDKRKPGLWKTEATLDKLDITGVPKGAEAQIASLKQSMQTQMSNQLGREECLTAEAAAKEDISKGFLQGISSGGQCELTKDTASGGKMDIAGTCTMGPSKMDIAMTGTMAHEKIDAVVTMKGGAPSGGPQMDMKMRVVATHVGDCPA
jgi:hypothetical protein